VSGILKAINKVFISPLGSIIGGKVGKIIKKVAIGAIAVGAVVLTGGAALGILPSLGTMVGGLGLSAGLTSVLTGAISTGAVGAVTGLVTGGFKGMTKGLLMGAATGGIMGGLGILGPNGLIGGGKAAASALGSGTGIAPSAAPSFMSMTSADVVTGGASGLGGGAGLTSVAPSFASAAAPTVASGAGASVASLGGGAAAIPLYGGAGAGAGGINPLLASQLLGGVSQALSPNEYKQKYGAEAEAAREQSFFAYGGGDSNGSKKGGILPGVYSNQPDPFGLKSYGAPPTIQPGNYYTPPTKRWTYDPTTSTVVERSVGS
jgi:hypothetical protein